MILWRQHISLSYLKLSCHISYLDMLNSVKLGYSGKILCFCQFLLLPQLPQKMMLTSKVVKSDLNIIITIH